MMWPSQKDADKFYGNPRGKNPAIVNKEWELANIEYVKPPFKMFYDLREVKMFQCHRLVADSLEHIFSDLWQQAHYDQKIVDEWGLSTFGGCYNYRLKRGASTLSMHAYGAAIDLDPANNAFHDKSFRFKKDSPVVLAFKAQGWTWGGEWRQPDAMHFQAAQV